MTLPSSTIFRPPAARLVAILRALSVPAAVTLKIPDVWLPASITPPAAVVELPAFTRTEPEGEEAELGSDLWVLTYPVALAFSLREAQATQERAAAVVEAFVSAVDADPSLAGTVYEAAVVGGDVEYDKDGADALLIYRTRVVAWKFVPTP